MFGRFVRVTLTQLRISDGPRARRVRAVQGIFIHCLVLIKTRAHWSRRGSLVALLLAH